MTGTVFLGASEYSVREGEPYVTVTFQRIGDTSGAVKIYYATSGNSATQGVDYTGINSSVIIPVGADSVTIRVPIKRRLHRRVDGNVRHFHRQHRQRNTSLSPYSEYLHP